MTAAPSITRTDESRGLMNDIGLDVAVDNSFVSILVSLANFAHRSSETETGSKLRRFGASVRRARERDRRQRTTRISFGRAVYFLSNGARTTTTPTVKNNKKKKRIRNVYIYMCGARVSGRRNNSLYFIFAPDNARDN